MKIDTLPEWNTVLAGCGCCAMPEGPVPEVVTDSIGIIVLSCGVGAQTPGTYPPWEAVPCNFTQAVFRKLRNSGGESRSDQGSFRVETVTTWARTPTNGCNWTTEEVDGFDGTEEDPGDLGIGFNPPEKTQGGVGGGGYFFNFARTGSSSFSGATWEDFQRWEYSEPVTDGLAELSAAADGFISQAYADRDFYAAHLNRDGGVDAVTEVLAETTCVAISPPQARAVRRVHVKYRWRVPVTHGGKYFKITWDILTEPTSSVAWKALADSYLAAVAAHAAWEAATATYAARLAAWEAKVTAEELWQARTDAMDEWITAGSIPPAPADPGDRVLPGDAPEYPGTEPEIPTHPGASPSPAATLEQNLTWVWTGPGDPEDAADASWLSPWFNLPPPTVNGERRIVNIRFESYRSAAVGSKPQLTGEGYEIPILP